MIKLLFPVLLLVLTLTACQDELEAPTTAEAVEFGDRQADNIYHHYLNLQLALADSDPKAAAAAAEALNGEFASSQTELRYLARHIAASTDVDVQRRYFFPMTDQLEPVFSDRMTHGTIYRMHCPAANNGIGADWYADANTTKNPYLGAAAPACGKVVKHIRG